MTKSLFAGILIASSALRPASPVFAQTVVRATSRPFTVVESNIAEMRQALEQKRTTSHAIVAQSLARIGMYEDKLHAVITVNPRALAIADSLDRLRARQNSRTAARD